MTLDIFLIIRLHVSHIIPRSIRELTVSKLYQSFAGTGTCTMTTEDEIMKRKGVDFKDLVHRKVWQFIHLHSD
jgi:hypothetical protein